MYNNIINVYSFFGCESNYVKNRVKKRIVRASQYTYM